MIKIADLLILDSHGYEKEYPKMQPLKPIPTITNYLQYFYTVYNDDQNSYLLKKILVVLPLYGLITNQFKTTIMTG